ncbi:polyadenylate-binding protein-interacting protein 1 isoform X1, partial [Tachysurus ichikawai]
SRVSTLSSSSSLSNSSSSAAVKPRASQSAVYESRLSAHAPEFIPSTYTPVQDDVYEEDSYDSYYSDFSLADVVQDILTHLNSSPGSFEIDIGNIAATLNDWVTTKETLKELMELIFTQVFSHTDTPRFNLIWSLTYYDVTVNGL